MGIPCTISLLLQGGAVSRNMRTAYWNMSSLRSGVIMPMFVQACGSTPKLVTVRDLGADGAERHWPFRRSLLI